MNVLNKLRKFLLKLISKSGIQCGESDFVGVTFPPNVLHIDIKQSTYEYLPIFVANARKEKTNEILFEVYNIKGKKKSRKKRLILSFSVNIKNWQFISLKTLIRMPLVEMAPEWFCQVLLSRIAGHERLLITDAYKKIRDQQEHFSEYTLSTGRIQRGEMLSYAEIATGYQRIDGERGKAYCFRLEVDGCTYLIDCLYCCNPSCCCHEVLFYVGVLNKRTVPYSLEPDGAFLYNFSKHRYGDVPHKPLRLSVKDCMAHLKKQIPGWLHIVRSQYLEIKILGDESLNRHNFLQEDNIEVQQ